MSGLGNFLRRVPRRNVDSVELFAFSLKDQSLSLLKRVDLRLDELRFFESFRFFRRHRRRGLNVTCWRNLDSKGAFVDTFEEVCRNVPRVDLSSIKEEVDFFLEIFPHEIVTGPTTVGKSIPVVRVEVTLSLLPILRRNWAVSNEVFGRATERALVGTLVPRTTVPPGAVLICYSRSRSGCGSGSVGGGGSGMDGNRRNVIGRTLSYRRRNDFGEGSDGFGELADSVVVSGGALRTGRRRRMAAVASETLNHEIRSVLNVHDVVPFVREDVRLEDTETVVDALSDNGGQSGEVVPATLSGRVTAAGNEETRVHVEQAVVPAELFASKGLTAFRTRNECL
jgi:hypothetical protein